MNLNAYANDDAAETEQPTPFGEFGEFAAGDRVTLTYSSPYSGTDVTHEATVTEAWRTSLALRLDDGREWTVFGGHDGGSVRSGDKYEARNGRTVGYVRDVQHAEDDAGDDSDDDAGALKAALRERGEITGDVVDKGESIDVDAAVDKMLYGTDADDDSGGDEDDSEAEQVECTRCHGTGERGPDIIDPEECRTCEGTGTVEAVDAVDAGGRPVEVGALVTVLRGSVQYRVVAVYDDGRVELDDGRSMPATHVHVDGGGD